MITKSRVKTLACIVPVYGHHGYIRDCIYSLNSQWLSLNQIIVVVDGDVDALKIVMECFYDSKVKRPFTIAMLDENSGTYCAQNVGLSLLDSDAVSFCGADDMWTPSRSRDVMRSFHNENSIVNTYHRIINSDGSMGRRSIQPLGGCYGYTKSMIGKLGMFRQWPCSADSDMFYRAQKLGGHLSLYRSYSYLYRQHGDQLTHRSDTALGSDGRAVYESMWHDGATFHNDDLANFRCLVKEGLVIE